MIARSPALRDVSTPLPPDGLRSVDGSWLAQTLSRLLDHVRSLMDIDGAAFLAVDRDRRTVEAVVDWFSSPDLREAIAPAGRRHYDPRRPSLAEVTLERDRALLLPRLEAWEAGPDLLDAAVDGLADGRREHVLSALREASVISCPVKTAIGRPLGVLVVASLPRGGSALGTGELRTVEVLADLASLAVERAELVEAQAHRAREELALKQASEAISSSLDLEEVYGQIVGHAMSLTGASKALLTRLDERTGDLLPAASAGFSEGFGRRPLDGGMLAKVARDRVPHLSRSTEAAGWDTSLTEREGIGSFMHAPIELGSRLYGVLSVAHPEVDRFGEEDLELLVRLARSSAGAIANAVDYGRERRIARALTLGFVPESLPEVAGYETGLHYAPAANEPTGGDVYGAWELPGGEVAVLVGDVAGKGVETAALSSMVRFFVEARSWDSSRPSDVLSRTNDMLLDRLPSDTFVTAFLGILTPGCLRYCNAGHLPPVHMSAGAPASLPGHGLPLGVSADPGYGDSRLELEPGDLVFAYTDGLVEARRAGELFGEERLLGLLSRHGRAMGPSELVRSVHDQVAAWAGGFADDVVALALRRRR